MAIDRRFFINSGVSASFPARAVPGWSRGATANPEKERRCVRVRTYKVVVFVPAFYPIEAKDEAEALEKVGEFYKGLYKKDFRELVEPLPEPQDVM